MLKKITLSFRSACSVMTGCLPGFMARQSCLSYHLLLKEKVIRLMDDSNTADVVYVDFAKPFDFVSHRFLLSKLESFGLPEKSYGSDPT